MTAATVYVFDLESGTTSIKFDCSTEADYVVEQAGLEPNGDFWQGIAELAVRAEAPHLEGRFNYDCEGSAFCAYGADRPALVELTGLLEGIINSPERVVSFIDLANKSGFVFG